MNKNRKNLHKVTVNVLGITLASVMAAGTVAEAAAPVMVFAAEQEQKSESKRKVYLDGSLEKAAEDAGGSKDNAVNTLKRALKLADGNAVIYVCGTVHISDEKKIRIPDGVEFRRAEGFEGALVKITGDGKLTVAGTGIREKDVDVSEAKLGKDAFVIEEKTEETKEEEKEPETKPEEDKPEETKPEDGKSEEDKSEETKPEDGESEEDKSEETKPEDGESEEDKSEETKPEDGESEEDKSEETKPEDGESEEDKSEETKPEDGESEEDKSEETKPEDGESEEDESEETKPEDGESEETKPEDGKSEEDKPDTGKDETDSENKKEEDEVVIIPIEDETPAEDEKPVEEPENTEDSEVKPGKGDEVATEAPQAIPVGSLIDETGVQVYGDFIPFYVDLQVSYNDAVDELPDAGIGEILSAYELKLWDLKEDEEYKIPEGKKVKVMIPLPENADCFSDLAIAHYLGNNEYEYFSFGKEGKSGNMTIEEKNGEEFLTFETASFSPFNVGGIQIVGPGTPSNGHKPPIGNGSSNKPGNGSNFTTIVGDKNHSNTGTLVGKPDDPETGNSGNKNNTGNKEVTIIPVKTGDETNVWTYVIAGAGALILAALALVLGKKKK